MCGRYILVQKQEVLEKRFNANIEKGVEILPSYNISPGQYAPVIVNEGGNIIKMFRFGLTPHWSKKSMLLINARSEGDYNKSNDPNFLGAKGIISKPAFRKPIRSQRCLIPADAFIEGPEKEKLSKPYLVYLKDKIRPFCFAGIYDIWENPETNDLIHSFAIITSTANSLLQKIPHHRSPVILPRNYEQRWINPKIPLSDVTALIQTYPGEKMNAYPISNEIKSPMANDKSLLLPIGERLDIEFEVKKAEKWELSGMGGNKSYNHDKDNPWGK